jgi:GNAT superfamily N-acetyltransferase
MADSPVPLLKAGSVDDIPSLVLHHRRMLDEIWKRRGIPVDQVAMKTVDEEYRIKLHEGFKSGSCYAWVISEPGRLLSSGAVSICSYVPVPHDPSCTVAFLHRIYTEEDQRRNGYAGRITREAASFCRTRGIRRLYLFASDEGRSVYEKIGFSRVENSMLLLVE